jgi:PhnB protein
MAVKPIPDGYHSVTPYITLNNAAAALEYYKKAFGAIELFRIADPSGRVGHAEMKIGDSVIMMSDEFPEMNVKSPKTLGGTPFGICLYVPNVDEVFAQAVAAGGTAERPLMNQFYGDRSGTIIDPFGHKWTISTHIEDISPEEMDRRAAEHMKQQKSA